MVSELSPFSRPLYVMAKPVGSVCNLACKYCYYLEKGRMYAGHGGSRFVMDDATLETFVRQYIEAQTGGQVLFTWHGGEPLMRPLSFYRKVLELQRRYADGRIIDNCIQTNGTLLTDEWCEFLRENNWLVGVSIDGPQHLHDKYRMKPHPRPLPSREVERSGSFRDVVRGINLMRKHGVEWNVMGVVNDVNADYPVEVYSFYKELGATFIQFTPVVERLVSHPDGRHLVSLADTADVSLAPFSVTSEGYARFVCGIFDEWVRHDVGRVFVQLFDSTLARWVGEEAGVCSMAETCGHAGVIEHNGDVYSCDHFVFPEYLLGNIHRDSITALMYSERQRAFGRAKRDALPGRCRECEWLFACGGGCPKDRFASDADGEVGLNYLCEGYRRYFEHVAPYMDFMRGELEAGRPPANVMRYVNERPHPNPPQ